MRRWALALGGIVLAAGAFAVTAWPPAPEVRPQTEIVLDNVVVVIPAGARAPHRRLVVREGRIAAIESTTRPGEPERYVLPGLIDMHVHLPPRIAPGLLDLFQLLLLTHGVTTIREVGSLDGAAFGIAGAIERGDRVGPRVIPCGPILDGEPAALPVARVVRSRADGEAIVHVLAARGARCVKVYEGISVDALAGIQDAAREVGLPVVGHLPSTLPLAELPLDDVQHLCYTRCGSASPEELEAFTERSATRGVAHTPTLVVFEGQELVASAAAHVAVDPYRLMPLFWREVLWRPVVPLQNREVLASMQALVRRLHARGVRIHAGTDPIQPFVVPGASVHRELELLVESGLSPEEALAAATSVAGTSLGIQGLGRIEVGAPADLLVLREDPTQDLAALGTLEAVIAGGRLYPIATLRAALEEQRRYFERSAVDLPFRTAARAAMEIARRSFLRAHAEASP